MAAPLGALPGQALRTPGTIWAKAIEQANEERKKPGALSGSARRGYPAGLCSCAVACWQRPPFQPGIGTVPPSRRGRRQGRRLRVLCGLTLRRQEHSAQSLLVPDPGTYVVLGAQWPELEGRRHGLGLALGLGLDSLALGPDLALGWPRFLCMRTPAQAEVPKPSEGIEYTYARKPAAYDHEKKDLAHIWEVGGSHEFAEELVNSDQLFLTAKQVGEGGGQGASMSHMQHGMQESSPFGARLVSGHAATCCRSQLKPTPRGSARQITTAVVVIIVDLSDPASVLPALKYWLEQTKKKLAATYEKFEKKGLQLPEQLRQRAKSKLYAQNEDKDQVYTSGISLVIAATKYDVFKNEDPEVKKVMSRCAPHARTHDDGMVMHSLTAVRCMGTVQSVLQQDVQVYAGVAWGVSRAWGGGWAGRRQEGDEQGWGECAGQGAGGAVGWGWAALRQGWAALCRGDQGP